MGYEKSAEKRAPKRSPIETKLADVLIEELGARDTLVAAPSNPKSSTVENSRIENLQCLKTKS